MSSLHPSVSSAKINIPRDAPGSGMRTAGMMKGLNAPSQDPYRDQFLKVSLLGILNMNLMRDGF